MSASRSTCFINAGLTGHVDSLRVTGEYVSGVGVRPARGDLVIDLAGDRLLPGLINAHDHLQFNNFPRTRYRDAHENVNEWIASVTAHRDRDPALIAAEALEFTTRLLAGGLKNLLSGATTVAHHDALAPALTAPWFPVRVLQNYGWTHSLGVCGEAEVLASERDTPADWPWIIHAGEGVDARAAAEFTRLDALGCIGPRSRLVHALGFDAGQISRLVGKGAAVIWCPSSNLFLFGRTLDARPLQAGGRLALGSDSRISGARDLLEELRVARQNADLDDTQLEWLVTRDNARLLGLSDRGELAPGKLADLVVLPRDAPLPGVERAQLRMVMVGGRMVYGDAACASALGPGANCIPVMLDGRRKVLDRRLVELLARVGWREPGLEIHASAWRAA